MLLTGHPCTGKSTVARRLRAALALPVFSKDHFQELLFDAGWPPDARRGPGEAANRAALAAARHVLAAGLDCGVDANLDPARWRDAVAAILDETGAGLLQVRCTAPGALLVQRFAARGPQRHPGHRDTERLPLLRERLLGPPLAALDLPGPVLVHHGDAAGPAPMRRLVAAVAAAMAQEAGSAASPRDGSARAVSDAARRALASARRST